MANRDTAVLVGVVAVAGVGLVLASQLGGDARKGVKQGASVGLGGVSFEYRGPAQQLWVNWGPKRSESTVQRLLPGLGVSFDNGQGLVSGQFASGGPIEAPRTVDWKALQIDVRKLQQKAVLRLTPEFFGPAQYDAWVWISLSPTVREDEFLQLFLSEAAVTVREA